MKVSMDFEFPTAYIEMGEVGVDEFVRNGLMPFASTLFKQAILDQITGPQQKTDNDLVPVTLRVKDWIRIADELYQDADAESGQIGIPETEDDWPPCHATGPATARCADKIDHALLEHGWTR